MAHRKGSTDPLNMAIIFLLICMIAIALDFSYRAYYAAPDSVRAAQQNLRGL